MNYLIFILTLTMNVQQYGAVESPEQRRAQYYIECLESMSGTDGECQWCYDRYNRGSWDSYEDAYETAFPWGDHE